MVHFAYTLIRTFRRAMGAALAGWVLASLVAAPAWALDADDVERRIEEGMRAANPRRPEAVVLETRVPGRAYLTQVDVKLAGRARHDDWGLGGDGNVTFGASMAFRSVVLANDGLTVVEERTYETMAAALVVGVDRIRFDFVNPKVVRDALLHFLAGEVPGAAAGARRALDWLLGEMDIQLGDRDIAFNERVVLRRDDEKLYAAVRLDALAGKTFRITYRNDGSGIARIEPVECVMLPEEEKLIRSGCYLFDAAFLDDGARNVGDRWTVPAAVFGNLLGGVVEGEPEGEVRFVRRADRRIEDAEGGERVHAVLEIDRDGTGPVSFRQAVKRGDGYVYEETGKLSGLAGAAFFARVPPAPGVPGARAETYLHRLEAKGLADVDARTRDHLLFQARFAAAPQMEVRYLSFPVPLPVAP